MGVGVSRQFEPERNCGDCLKLMQSMVWCVTYKLVAAVLERVVKGARFGCHHCQGVIVHCYRIGAGCCGDEARSLALARASAAKGSRCGHCVLGHLSYNGAGEVAWDNAAAVVQYRPAAAQHNDAAQNLLGFMYRQGAAVARNHAKTMRWLKLV